MVKARLMQLQAEDRSVEALKDFIGQLNDGRRPEKLDIQMVETVEELYEIVGSQL